MFFKETDFQETPIGRFPRDWSVTRLQNICEKVRAGGTPLTSKKEYWNGDLPFVKIEDITLASKYLTSTKSFISKEGLSNSNAWLVPENSLLFAMYGSMGEVSINKIPVTTNQAILGIIPQDRDDVEFLYYWYSFFKPRWKKYAKPTTQANLTAEIVCNSIIPLPPQEERRTIAEILSVVDSVIAKTDEVIAKTERLKKGLMQTLLTRGIGHKEFKETEIGRIPKEWEVVRLGNKELTKIIMGQSPPSSTYNKEGEGLPFLQGKMEFGEIYPSPVFYCSQPVKIAEQNDILISVRAPVGSANIAPYKICIGRGLAAIRFNSDKANNWFYFYYFQKIQTFLENVGRGSTFKALTKDDLENLKMPYPPLSEQKRVGEILSAIDKKLEFEKKEKVRWERIKLGLMNLLLTGRIRIKVR